MMGQGHLDVLIAGGGLAGLLLARALRERGRKVLVAADPGRPPASHAAVGLLNPVMGRRGNLAWMAAAALPLARTTYTAIARAAGDPAIFRELPIRRTLRTREEEDSWATHAAAIRAAGFTVRAAAATDAGWRTGERSRIEILGGGLVDPAALHRALRTMLEAADAILLERCRPADVVIRAQSVHWMPHGITAAHLIVAGGADDAGAEGFIGRGISGGEPVQGWPVRAVQGETLQVRIPGLAPTAIHVAGHFLAPRNGDIWVCGATQAPGVADAIPTTAARGELEAFLAENLEVPWTVLEQRAGVRAVTPDQRPIAGPLSPDGRVLGCNGLGSRGITLAPWLAEQLAAHLTNGTPLRPEIRPERFLPVTQAAERWHAVHVARAEALVRARPGDTVLDLTVGNGGDTTWLAEAVGPRGVVWGFDIQSGAIAAARRKLAQEAVEARVELICEDHALLARHLPTDARGHISVAVANLGHWPGADSAVVTQPGTTLAAFAEVLRWLRPGGALVAVCYRQHAGGPAETTAVAAWSELLDCGAFRVTWRDHPAGHARAPRVRVVERGA